MAKILKEDKERTRIMYAMKSRIEQLENKSDEKKSTYKERKEYGSLKPHAKLDRKRKYKEILDHTFMSFQDVEYTKVHKS